MEKINIYEAKTHLSRIVQDVARTGEPVLISKHGQTLVKVIAYREEIPRRQLGFLKGRGKVPADFDELKSNEIIELFEGK